VEREPHAPPEPDRSVYIANGAIMLGSLLAASYFLSRNGGYVASYGLRAWDFGLLASLLGSVLLAFFFIGYGALFRRRAWLARAAASVMGVPVLFGLILTAVTIGAIWFHWSSPPLRREGLRLLLGEGVVLAVLLSAVVWARRVNRRWAERLATWEAECRSGDAIAQRAWAEHGRLHFSVKELLALMLVVALVAGVSRGLSPDRLEDLDPFLNLRIFRLGPEIHLLRTTSPPHPPIYPTSLVRNSQGD